MKLDWSRKHTLAAGAALIAVTNAIALGGVAWNRAGEPDSVLTLSQRELAKTTHGFLDRENGGMTLSLRVRVLTAESALWSTPYHYGAPEWLDQAKLASLGFDVSPPSSVQVRDSRYERQLPREALIVLELDGPAYRKALERARESAKKAAAGEGAGVDRSKALKAAQGAAENLERETNTNSRLFAVDAGRDAAELRAKYPDRIRYAIVPGKVRMHYRGDRGNSAHWEGFVDGAREVQINVGRGFRQALEAMPAAPEWGAVVSTGPAVQVKVAFGKRLEPWIVAASAVAKK